ncbi:MAG TPA: M3 family metallopeptidase [Bacteroidales bacterium]|nr:M3 family metallopeptidase [Bacteroidales bacterium]
MKIYTFFLLVFILAIVLPGCKTKPVTDSANPFFKEFDTPYGVPPFDRIFAKHYIPAMEQGMAEERKDLEKILGNTDKPNFRNTIEPFDSMGSLLNRVTTVFSGLTSANTNDSLQKIQIEISPRLSKFSDEIMLNPELFRRVRAVYETMEQAGLDNEQKFIVDNLYKNFVRNGALLSPADQDTLKKINEEISVLAVKFSQNVLSETNKFKLVIDKKDDLKGLPENVVAGAAQLAKRDSMAGKWIFTTQKPSMLPFLTYADSRELRKKLYDAYLSRCDHNDNLDNKKNLERIVVLRARRARLLGFKSHADLKLENRMARNPENVYALLNQLWKPALKVAGQELAEMQKIANAGGAKFSIEPSDWWYYAEKLRKQKYNLDDNELRPYFKLDNVREGAFMVANKLYGITFTPITGIPLPHPDAMAFEVKDTNKAQLGILYMDFYARTSKGQGAWCGSYRPHRWSNGKEVKPIVTLVTNFSGPSGDTPALLSLDDVKTLFHEFGHALQGLFSANRYANRFAAMDIIELPSQINEHWAIQPEVLKMYARNYRTGEIIPDNLIARIQKSSHFNTGFDNVELLAASMLDMAYYTLGDPATISIGRFEDDYMKKIGLIKEIKPRYRSTYFLHIIRGYDAGYYCYTWAAVLDNDAFEAFREKGIFDRTTALSFRKNVLAPMGIVDSKQSYINFRGRDPEIGPLLRNRGLE